MKIIITRPSPAIPGSVSEVIMEPSTPADQLVLNQLQQYDTRGVGIDLETGYVTYVRLELKERYDITGGVESSEYVRSLRDDD